MFPPRSRKRGALSATHATGDLLLSSLPRSYGGAVLIEAPTGTERIGGRRRAEEGPLVVGMNLLSNRWFYEPSVSSVQVHAFDERLIEFMCHE